MDNLLITSTDIKYFRWNGERKGQHKIKKSPGKVSVINRETGTEVFSGTTVEEAEKFFVDETPIDFIWSRLRETCDIEKGVTLKNIQDIIEKNEHFGAIVRTFYLQDIEMVSGEPVGDLVIKRRGVIDNGEYLLKATVLGDLSKNGRIILDKNFSVLNEGKELFTGEMEWSLLEIVDAIFGKNLRSCTCSKNITSEDCPDCSVKPVSIQKNGINDSHGQYPFTFDHLMTPCTIGEDVTLGDIFKMVEADEGTKIFMSMYSWCRAIDEFHKAALSHAVNENDGLKYLKIGSGIEVYEDKDYSTISDSMDFYGFGPTSEDTLKYYKEVGKEPPENETYGLGFSSMSELANLPVKIGECRLSIFGKNENGIDAKRTYTLLQILDAIYWEISFYGGPKEAADMKEELCRRVDEVKSGNAKTIPFEDVMKELEDTFKEEE